MSDEEPIFDPSLKKKKKKKKTPFDIDSALGGEDNMGEEKTNDHEKGADEDQEPTADKDDLDDFTNLTKKKKKKKKPFDLTELEEAIPKEENSEEREMDPDAIELDLDADLDLTLPSKKKKKKKVVINLEATEPDAGIDEGTGKESEGKAWVDSDRDYTYEELLTRVFDIMREKNPEMVAGEKKRIVMKPPQVMRAGAKKTSFVNFTEVCKMLHRQQKHLLAFLFAELGTSGSIDGSNQLIIKGKFQQKQIENVLRRYIKEYVTCHTCRSPDTILQKDTRLYFLQCETCGSRCSVASIKSGFQAVTSKRSVIRAKTA